MSTVAQPWAKYAAPADASASPWEKYGGGAPTPTIPVEPEGNALQRGFDKLTTVTPEQEAGHSWPVNKLQEFGAGAIQSLSPLVHPLDTLQSAVGAIAHPEDTGKAMLHSAEEHPAQTLGNLVGGLVEGGVGAELGEGALKMLPSKARAGATLQEIRTRPQTFR